MQFHLPDPMPTYICLITHNALMMHHQVTLSDSWAGAGMHGT